MKTAKKPQKQRQIPDSAHALDNPISGLQHHCFGCAPENRTGLHLKFRENPDDRSVESEFRMPRRFEGPPGHLHGGIIATVLDEAMGKVNRRKGVVALTRRISVDYLLPVPLATRLRVVGWCVKVQGRKHFHAAEIRALTGEVLAHGEGLFIAVDPEQMFRKYRQRLTLDRRG